MTRNAALSLVLGLTIWRVGLLWFNRTDLYVDEAQYWYWSRSLDWGYFSKPPLIGWIIRLSTELGGSEAPFWVRLPAPLLHALGALGVGLVGARLHGERLGALAAASYAAMPGVSLGSQVISTDTAALPFCALALWLWLRMAARWADRRGPERADPDQEARWRDALLAGGLLGVGFLGKYAAAYFIVGAILAALGPARLRVGWRAAALAGVAFFAVIAGNLWWNAANGFITASHTAHNAAVEKGFSLNFQDAGEFLAAQLLVMGPILFPAMLWAARPGRALTWFSVPIVALVTFQALRAGANINWAALAYAPGVVLALAVLAPRWARVSLALTTLIAVALPLTATVPDAFAREGQRGVYARLLSRAEVAEEIAARAGGVATLIAENRNVLADLSYTLRDRAIAIHAPPTDYPGNSWELMAPLPPDFSGPALFVGGDPARLPGLVAATELPRIDPPVGGWMKRPLTLWRVEISPTGP